MTVLDICLNVSSALLIIVVTACVTIRVCNRELMSEWLIVKLKTGVVEPTDIFICKECYAREAANWRYCKNCGRRMRNGKAAIYSYSDDIEL